MDVPPSPWFLPNLSPTTADVNPTSATNLPATIDLTESAQAPAIDDTDSSPFETPVLASVITQPLSETPTFIPVPKALPEEGSIPPPQTLKRLRTDDLDDDYASTPQNGKKRYFQDNHQHVPSDRPLSPLEPGDLDALLDDMNLFSW